MLNGIPVLNLTQTIEDLIMPLYADLAVLKNVPWLALTGVTV